MSDFKQIGTPRQIFIGVPSIKFHGNPSSGRSADTCGQTDGWTDKKKVTGTIRDYAEAPPKSKKKIKKKQEKKMNLKMEKEGTRNVKGRRDKRSE